MPSREGRFVARGAPRAVVRCGAGVTASEDALLFRRPRDAAWCATQLFGIWRVALYTLISLLPVDIFMAVSCSTLIGGLPCRRQGGVRFLIRFWFHCAC